MSIGVLLSTYNGENYLICQLESLRKQDYQSYNLYISDDCSTDNSYNLIADYIKKYSLNNWFLSRNGHNKGWRKNFIELIKNCNDDIIFLCDQDDYWMHDKISSMVEILSNNPEIDLLCSNYVEFRNDAEINTNKVYKRPILTNFNKDGNLLKIDRPGCTYCFRKRIVDQVLMIWKEFLSHDTAVWITAFLNHGLYIMDRPCIYWRKHKESVFGDDNVRKTLKIRMEYIKNYQRFFNELCRANDDNIFAFNDGYKSVLNRYRDWFDYRSAFLIEGRMRYFFKIILYLDLYPTFLNFCGDVYAGIKKCSS